MKPTSNPPQSGSVESKRAPAQEQECTDRALRASDEQFASAFKYAAIGMALVSPEGRFLKVNRALCQMLDYPEAELLALDFQEITHGDDLGADLEYVRQLLAGKITSYEMKKRYFQKGGGIVWSLLSVSLVRDQGGAPIHFISQVQDITERKQAEATRFEREQEFEALVENAPDIVSRYDREFRHLYVNRAVTQATGLPAAAFIGQTHEEMGMPRHLFAEWRAVLEDVFASGRERETEFEFPAPGGPRFYHSRLVPERAPDGSIRSVLNIARDITERKQSAEALRESQAHLRFALESAQLGDWDLDLATDSARRSLRHDQCFGYDEPLADWGFEKFMQCVHPEDRERVGRDFRAAAEGLKPWDLECRVVWPDGSLHWISAHGDIYRQDGSPIRMLGIVADITEQRQAQEAIRRQAHMLDEIGLAVIATDTEGTIAYANRFAGELYAWKPEEMRGRNIMDVTVTAATREHAEDIMDRLRKGECWSGEFLVQIRNGRVFPAWVTNSPLLDEDGRLVGIIGISTDISSRKQADAQRDEMNKQLVDASRRAGRAEIATSVLHNVGNVLNSVNISAALASDKIRQSSSADLTRVAALFQEHREDLPGFLTSAQGVQLPAFLTTLAASVAGDQHVALAELQSLSANIDHIKEIVAMQQNYARMAAVIEALTPASLVEDALQLDELSLERHGVKVIREYAETPQLEVDKHKALQILVNLIRNAKQAMSGVPAEDRRLTLRISSQDDAMIRIAVADAGVGIPAENLARLFEHGFTNRAEGHGFGLHSAALAAKELGGALTVHSDGPGKGAVFTLILPLQAHHSPSRKL